MANPKGELRVKARGKEYRLHLGMSVLADLQEKFGDDLDKVFSQPSDGKLPDLRNTITVFMAALQRYHSEEADRWLVDDIITENQNSFAELVSATFPDAGEAKDSPKGKKKPAG
jgi:hypothetical protein